jgi:hypothetical protein
MLPGMSSAIVLEKEDEATIIAVLKAGINCNQLQNTEGGRRVIALIAQLEAQAGAPEPAVGLRKGEPPTDEQMETMHWMRMHEHAIADLIDAAGNIGVSLRPDHPVRLALSKLNRR